MYGVLKGFDAFICVLFLSLCSTGSFAQKSMNLDFEVLHYTAPLPKNWYVGGDGYHITQDSIEKHAGKRSLRMEMQGNSDGNLECSPARCQSNLLRVKTWNIKGGLKPKTLKKDMPDYGLGLTVMTRLYLGSTT